MHTSLAVLLFAAVYPRALPTYVTVKETAATKTATVASADHYFALCFSAPLANCFGAQVEVLGEICFILRSLRERIRAIFGTQCVY